MRIACRSPAPIKRGRVTTLMAEEAKFQCLRCGTEFKLPYTLGSVEERSCPRCKSNSVRMIKEKKQ